MKVMSYVLVGAVASIAGPALADDAPPPPIEQLTPGVAAPQTVKATLPRRENPAVGVVSADLVGGSHFGLNAALETRVWESFGGGLGVRLAGRGGVFLRLDVMGLTFNHWGVISYVDYVVGNDFLLTGAVIIPLRGDNYIRASLAQSIFTNYTGWPSTTTFGVGMEHDLW
jgi:hypothetical protein